LWDKTLSEITQKGLRFSFNSYDQASRIIWDYNLLHGVTVISYAAGYVHGAMAVKSIEEPRRDEVMATSCRSLHEDIPLEEAKALIKGYFEEHHGEDLDYGDLREALCIALPIIVEACDQLEREGKIAGVD
jgi:hypothetical protein